MQFRLKAFITDYARVKTAKVALLDIDDVIRIQTDGIVCNIPKTYPQFPDFIPEKDKTCLINWVSLNKPIMIKKLSI